jgi:hypothetical protein
MHHQSSRSRDHLLQQHEVLMLVLTKNPMMQRVPADRQQGSN